MKIGVDYFPEQWDSSLWNQDADLMARIGVKTVRLGGIMWPFLEPADGEFEFSWLDDAIGIFSHFGIEVVLCIPTDCPPAWLYREHPDIIRTSGNEDSLKSSENVKRCVNSPVFMSYAKRITQQMIRRYGANPTVSAWQIDSGIDAAPCMCDSCRSKFRDWLLDKHDDLENINAALGAKAWYGNYSDVSQIQPPAAYEGARHNPALDLEFYRFTSESAAAFVKELAIIIHREAPKARVTTNARFSKNTPDMLKLFNDLDFVSYNNYFSNISGTENGAASFDLDLMRGIHGKSFCVMEQLSRSPEDNDFMLPTPKPGMIMGYALQALAHGADTIIHSRWRTAIIGSDMFSNGIIDHSNIPGRRFFEFSELCKTASKLSVIDTTALVSEIAILYSPENEYAVNSQPQAKGFSYMRQLKSFHSAFSRYGANIDIVSPDSDLSRYKVVVAPEMYVYRKSSAENIYRYVIKGGTLIMTNRSGVKDNNNNCVMEALPTVYKELIGAEITEYDPIGSSEQTIVDFAGNKFTCSQWCDILKLTTAKAYAEYSDSFYRCCPAVTMNKYCSGVVYYVGTVCKNDFYESFVENVMRQTGIPRLKGLPRGVEVTTRTNGLDEFIFFFNNSSESAVVSLPKPMYSIIDLIGKDRVDLKPYEMDIVRK